jgi:hypothetical protein
MAYSGTISQTTFNTRRVIDNAARRCRIPAQALTAEYLEDATDTLHLLLSELPNHGLQLWTIEKQIYPLYEGVSAITTDAGTVDILNSNLRSLQPVTGTTTDTSTTRTVDFTNATVVSTVGVKWTAAAVPIALERSDDGATWTTVQTETPSASAGEWTWYDLASSVAARYFRVRATSGTLSFSQIYLGNTPTEIPLARLNRDDYTNLPNKTFQSNRPLQFWFDRQVSQPVMRFWPIPNADAETSQIVLWRQRQIMDVGTLTEEIEVPQRWYEAVVAMLASKLALEIPEVDVSLIPLLDQRAAQAMYMARMEERDNSPMRIAPNISMYTA